jgi:CYTH domain-containing protein
MNFEIERKFLIRGDEWRGLVADQVAIRQAYLEANAKASIRVRIRDNASATLTIKSRASALRRLELEYPIPIVQAEALIQLRQGIVIEKSATLFHMERSPGRSMFFLARTSAWSSLKSNFPTSTTPSKFRPGLAPR